jgi:hypothetical protein
MMRVWDPNRMTMGLKFDRIKVLIFSKKDSYFYLIHVVNVS